MRNKPSMAPKNSSPHLEELWKLEREWTVAFAGQVPAVWLSSAIAILVYRGMFPISKALGKQSFPSMRSLRLYNLQAVLTLAGICAFFPSKTRPLHNWICLLNDAFYIIDVKWYIYSIHFEIYTFVKFQHGILTKILYLHLLIFKRMQ